MLSCMDAARDITAGGSIPRLTLPRRLRLAREAAGFKQEELAAITGISARSVHNYESGFTSPRKPVLLTWAVTTGVPLAWLADGIDTEAEPCPSCGGNGSGEGHEEPRNRCCSETPSVRCLSEHRHRRAADRIEELLTLI